MAALCVALGACRSQQEHAYIKDAPRNETSSIVNLYSTVVMPDDLLYIFVYSETPEATIPFNEETNKGVANAEVQGYRVSESGNISFPVLGRIEAAGHTLDELAATLERRLRNEGYVNDAIVSIELLNFHVAVIGEVQRPSIVHSASNRLTIFEAIAQCGDITMDGLRDRVVVVRQGPDEQLVDTLNLTSQHVLNSPYYYLQQNDIVYVEPTPKKKRQAYRDEDWPRYITISATAVGLAYQTIQSIAYLKR